MKIVFCGGGTGGHIFPIVAIVRELKKSLSAQNLELFYLGPKDEFLNYLKKENLQIKIISAGKIRRYLTFRSLLANLKDIVKIIIGIIQSFFFLRKIRPNLIFSKGGFGSLPPVIVGHFLKIPIFLHESDIVAGWSTKICSKFAKKIFLAFPKEMTNLTLCLKGEKKCFFVGNPIREELIKGNKEEGQRIFNLTNQKPVLLILGGSQGAQRINDTILKALLEILELFEVIHQCGEKNLKEMQIQTEIIFQKNPSLKKYYHLYGFLKERELKHAYKVANLVISRAGAGIIFELLANGLPSILVPLPESAQNHQSKNAYFVERYGAGIVIEQGNFKPHFLLKKLHYLFSNPEILNNMQKRAKEIAILNSAQIISQHILAELNL